MKTIQGSGIDLRSLDDDAPKPNIATELQRVLSDLARKSADRPPTNDAPGKPDVLTDGGAD